MKTVIGLDPGINHTGWGVINSNKGDKLSLIAANTITTNSKLNMVDRLYIIHTELTKIITSYNINEASLEEVFINKNPKSSIVLCYVRGVLLLTLRMFGIPISEYSANYIKKSLTGNGHADKEQMIFMIKCLIPGLHIERHDTADALAAAICHSYL